MPPASFPTEVLYPTLTPELRFLPEGPYPVAADCFSWVAIQHGPDDEFGSLNLFDLKENRNESYELMGRPGFAFPASSPNVFVIGMERTLGLISLPYRQVVSLAENVDRDVAGTIINEGRDERA